QDPPDAGQNSGGGEDFGRPRSAVLDRSGRAAHSQGNPEEPWQLKLGGPDWRNGPRKKRPKWSLIRSIGSDFSCLTCWGTLAYYRKRRDGASVGSVSASPRGAYGFDPWQPRRLHPRLPHRQPASRRSYLTGSGPRSACGMTACELRKPISPGSSVTSSSTA